MPAETLLQTFFTRLGFQTDTKGLDEYKDKLVDLSSSLLKLSGVASLSLGGLFEFTRRTLEPMANVARLSETYSVATDTLAAFGRMGREVGIDTNVMMNSIGELSRKMGEVASPAAARLRKLTEGYGLSVQKAGGDVRVFLGDVAERMQSLSAQEQVNLVTKMGLDPSMVRILRNGREEFEKLYDVTSKGLPFTEDDYRKAERFQIEFAKARAALGVFSSQIALTLMPAFQRAMESFLTWWRTNGERVMERVKYWVKLFADWLENALSFLGRLAGETDLISIAMKVLGAAVAVLVGTKLVSWVTSAASAMKALATANWLANLPMIAMAAAIVVIIGLILLLIDDFETWKKGGESVIGKMLAWWDKGAKGMEKFRDIVKWIWAQLRTYWEWAVESWSAAFEQIKKTLAAWWPEIKDGLILVGTLLGIALVAVVAFALGVAVLAAKVIEWIGKILVWFKKLRDEPEEALGQLADFIWSLIDKAGDWLRAMSAKGEAAIKAWFSSMLDQAEKWINDLLDGIGKWISGARDRVVTAFLGIFKAAIDAVRTILEAFWNEWIGKIVGIADKVKGVFGKAAPAAVGTVGGEAPPILETGATAVPMLGPNVGGRWVDTSNSNNLTQNNTITVQSAEEANDFVKQAAVDAKKTAAAAAAIAQVTVF